MHKVWQLVPGLAALATASLLAVSAGPADAAVTDPPASSPVSAIVPKPVSATETGGPAFTLTHASHIVASAEARPVGEYLAAELRRATGFPLPVTSERPHPGDIVLDLGPGKAPAGHADEGYTVTTTADTATIAADRPAGLFDGVQTLRQLFPVWIDSRTPVTASWTAPAAHITDYPRFGFRGGMLDVARSFLTVDEVERYVDQIARLKVNELHLHLADDQAWRIVIDNPRDNPSHLAYDRLSALGGTGGADVYDNGQPLGTELAHRGFYTQDEYKTIVAYAQSRFVTIVPEIDGPGHVNAALATIPQLNPDGVAKPMNNTADVGYSTLQANSPVTYEFLHTIWAQLAALTPGAYVHIGGDEAHVTGHDNYLTYIGRTVPIINALGKKTIGWNEYADVDLPAGSLVQYWDGPMDGVLKQVGRGAKVVMSPASTSYLDQKYNPSSPIGLTWACKGSCDFDRYYNWDPVQNGLHENDIAGVEAPLWSETVRGIDQANWLTFPRLASIAEIGWTPQPERSLPDFTTRLATLGARWTLQDTNFYPTPAIPWPVNILAHNAQLTESHPLTGEIARFTAPADNPSEVTATIDFGDGTTPTTGTINQPHPKTSLSANGVFSVTTSDHRYAAPGTYRGAITVFTATGRHTAPFTITVAP